MTKGGDMFVHRTLVVPSALRNQCADLCAQLAGGGGAGMFIAPLCTSKTITHYISSGLIDSVFAALLADVDALFFVCQSAGLSITKPELIVILGACDISDEPAQTAMDRLGLHKPALLGDMV